MGLDMYVIKAPKGSIKKDVDFKVPEGKEQGEVHYWRKHPNMHGWMENLYREKGGKEPDFNGDNVKLTEDDIDSLETAINEGALPETSGFFFGKSDGSEKDDDLQFISEARAALKTHDIYYTSWW